MLTNETFWEQVAAYNDATLPAQIGLVFLALVLSYFAFVKPNKKTNIFMKAFLSLAFAWNGIVFFLIYAENPISTFIGAPLFISLAILFAADIFKKKIRFKLPEATWQKFFTFFWLILVFLYPMIGFFLGHYYPKTCMPMMPCPLTIFAIAMITAAIPRVDKKIYILLLPWALMGLPKCFGALDCHEDCILFGSGVYSLILLIKNWPVIGKKSNAKGRYFKTNCE